jgi:ubiquinone/menaquinone biosynthesis C-methylase UbiE
LLLEPEKKFAHCVNCLILGWLLLSFTPTPQVYAQLGKRPAKDYIPLLENPSRIERLKPEEVLLRLKLKKGDVVADVGAGSGVFTRRLAQAVGPQGKVFAVDIDQELLDYNRKKIQEAELGNVEFILGAFDDPKLPADSIDLVFLCDVVHHIEHRQTYLGNLRPCLKRGGRVAVIDYKTNWPAGHEQMKYSLEELLAWTKSAGFQKTEEYDLIPDAFFFIFEPTQK